ncbi:hypothetical protein [Parapedobacter sp. 10938]|uniref:hypothetical protein n=1 Tax=Parapedobacter flavus TaxID=3110225 RepID=UPI002DC04F88|nr:hypothetical protein [Parapedobacter sp. 10938]MEC3881910.1 hypothetical protein [Parapedobacter sp. 10938]
MEKLTINVPNSKSSLVKQLLNSLGVIIQKEEKASASAYKKKLIKVSTWSDDDVATLELGKRATSNSYLE